MKFRHMFVLAATGAMMAAPCAHGTITIGAVYNFSDPFLVANNLMSVTIRLEGIQPGEKIQGFTGTPAHPWNISTTSSAGFFNLAGTFGDDGSGNPTFDGATSFYAATPLSAPGSGDAGRFDSGFLGNPSLFGDPFGVSGSGVGGFALSGDGSSDVNIQPVAWITTSPAGFDPPGSTYNFLRLTFSVYSRERIELVLAMNTPVIDIPLVYGPPIWDAGGPCCLPNGGCEEMFIIPCLQQGGTLLAPIVNSCENCPNYTCMGDIAPAGGDNIVNVEDLLAVINAWGPCANPNNCPADLAPRRGFGNNIVNVADLLAVVNRWGACPP